MRVTASGRDSAAEALLAYLTSGQLREAGIIAPELVEQARRLFQDKRANVEGAAIAGYFLLRVGEQETLRDWPTNFANWFSWLSDAAIIHAWQLLRRPNVPERELAKRQLLRAARRGVPRYTEGLRLLYRGLQTFASVEPNDPDIAAQLADVGRYAAACDWTAPLTTYWAERPDMPTLKRRTGLPASPGRGCIGTLLRLVKP